MRRTQVMRFQKLSLYSKGFLLNFLHPNFSHFVLKTSHNHFVSCNFFAIDRAFFKEKKKNTDSLSGLLPALYMRKNSAVAVFQDSANMPMWKAL